MDVTWCSYTDALTGAREVIKRDKQIDDLYNQFFHVLIAIRQTR